MCFNLRRRVTLYMRLYLYVCRGGSEAHGETNEPK